MCMSENDEQSEYDYTNPPSDEENDEHTYENVNFCPWCGDEVTREMEHVGGVMITGKKCESCDVLFRVQVPYPSTEIEWSNAR